MLVAVRTWAVPGDPVDLRTDSACAVDSLSGLRTKIPSVLRVALELALDLAEDKLEVQEFQHIPRVTSLEADGLSRLYAPPPQSVRASLADVPRALPVNRDRAEFWRATGPPRGARLLRPRRPRGVGRR